MCGKWKPHRHIRQRALERCKTLSEEILLSHTSAANTEMVGIDIGQGFPYEYGSVYVRRHQFVAAKISPDTTLAWHRTTEQRRRVKQEDTRPKKWKTLNLQCCTWRSVFISSILSCRHRHTLTLTLTRIYTNIRDEVEMRNTVGGGGGAGGSECFMYLCRMVTMYQYLQHA